MKNILFFALGVCVGVGIAAYQNYGTTQKQCGWISYDIKHMKSQEIYIKDLLDKLEDPEH